MITSKTQLLFDSSDQIEEVKPNQYKDIKDLNPNDVICGRGGESNNHVGNANWRKLVSSNKKLYLALPKKHKTTVALKIVREIRSLNPPGRFLQRNDMTGRWEEIGDICAKVKTAQALREGAPRIRDITITNDALKKKMKSEIENWYRSCLKHFIEKAHLIQQLTQGGNAVMTKKLELKLRFPPDMCPKTKKICNLAGITPEAPQPDISPQLINFLIDYGDWVFWWKDECDLFIDKMRVYYEISYGTYPANGTGRNSCKLTPPVPTSFPPDMPTIARKFCIEAGIMPFAIDGLPSFSEIIRRRTIPFKTDPIIPVKCTKESENMMTNLLTLPFLTLNMGAMPQTPLPTGINSIAQQNLGMEIMLQNHLPAVGPKANQHQQFFAGNLSSRFLNKGINLGMNQVLPNAFIGHASNRASNPNSIQNKNDKKRTGLGENCSNEEKKTRLFYEASSNTARNIDETSDRHEMDTEIPQIKHQSHCNSSLEQNDIENVTSAFKPNPKGVVIDDFEKTNDKDNEENLNRIAKRGQDDMNACSTQHLDNADRLFFQGIEYEIKKAKSFLDHQPSCSIDHRNNKIDTHAHPDLIDSSEK